MAGKRTGRCAFCGQTFTVERRAGPAPRYCSQAHRQRAYEQRRRATRGDVEHDLAQQVRTLQARMSGLERENRELRRDRDEAIEEIARLQQQLHPLSPTVQRLASRQQPAEPPAPTPPPRRRWNLSR